jgi:Zn-dependent peptidase ImmA (M78 family)/transcriptional regulator with XRE-family HTH domain
MAHMKEQTSPMDPSALGRRVREARERAGWSLAKFAEFLEIGEEEAKHIEDGTASISSEQILKIADGTRRSLSWFLEAPLRAIASRRASLAESGESGVDTNFDRTLEEIGLNVRHLTELGLLSENKRPHNTVPRDVESSEALAHEIRHTQGMEHGPLDLITLCDNLGLITFSLDVEEKATLGSMIEVSDSIGVALINGARPPGQRKYTLAHELGHWIIGDDYEALRTGAKETERLIDAFAAHLLLPRGSVTADWNTYRKSFTPRDAAIKIAANYGTSWSATISQLNSLSLIGHPEHELLGKRSPSPLDFEIIGANWVATLDPPFVSSKYKESVISGFKQRKITTDRALDLLLGTISIDELPERPRRAPRRRRQNGAIGDTKA